jgi:predicted oxidoreductase (fatty acid repression mutant protein)
MQKAEVRTVFPRNKIQDALNPIIPKQELEETPLSLLKELSNFRFIGSRSQTNKSRRRHRLKGERNMSNVEALKTRRSFYNINKDILVSEETILNLIEETVKYTPSAFNSESQRVVVLLNEKHEQVWEMVKAAIKKLVPENEFKKSEDKINAFKAGYGTILFFDDAKTTEALIEKFPLYKANFLRSGLSNKIGMLQGNVWGWIVRNGYRRFFAAL